MAGGPFARVIPCDTCRAASVRAPAERVYEGSENDRYACARGHTFLIHWRALPTKPLWIDDARIAERAYALYLDRTRSGGAGDAVSDWLAAEAEITGR